MIAVCSIGCERKAIVSRDGCIVYDFAAWSHLFDLDGDYSLYLNFESSRWDGTGELAAVRAVRDLALAHQARAFSFDVWQSVRTRLGSDWRPKVKFDQDQARLIPIVTARNMCVDYALLTQASHILFIDSDVIPPKNVIPKLLELKHSVVGGIVPGRGCHSTINYVFGQERTFTHESGAPVSEVRHGTCGCMMIERRVFDRLRFRFSVDTGLSEDPAFAMDAQALFDEKMWLRSDVVCQHIGDLKSDEIAQF